MDGADAFNIILLVSMGTALGLGFFSAALRNRFIASEPVFALAIGVAVGPFGLDWIELGKLSEDAPMLLEQLARIVLAIAILAACLRVGWPWARRHMRDVLLILLIGLPVMWALSALALGAALPLSLLAIVLIAAVVTPTDPVLAQAVVTASVAEEKVPEDLRKLLSLESAANDGLALVFVMIAVLSIEHGAPTGTELAKIVLWEIGGALAAGAALGWCVGRAIKATGPHWATDAGLITASTGLALVTMTGLKLLGMDGIFGVFAAGLALSALLGEEHGARHITFNHTTAELFELPFVVVIGVALPIGAWAEMGWPLAVAVVLVLLLRRLPMMLLLGKAMRTVPDWPSAVFAGWFGPIGVAAVFYAAFAMKETGLEDVFTVATAVIAGSIVAHGLTDTLGARLMGRYGSPRRGKGD